jgi:hypothetical protein
MECLKEKSKHAKKQQSDNKGSKHISTFKENNAYGPGNFQEKNPELLEENS